MIERHAPRPSAGSAPAAAERVMRMVAMVVVAIALLPSRAAGYLPGDNLGWNSCAVTYSTSYFNFACDDNTLTKYLVASFRLATSPADYVGASGVLTFIVGAGSPMPWWSFGPGGCREGAFRMESVPDGIGGCTSPYVGRQQAGGFLIDQLGPDRWRIRADWAADAAVPLVADTRYAAMVFALSTERTVDDGSGYCEGCTRQACWVLEQLEVFTMSPPYPHADITEAEVRNWVVYQGAFVGDGCVTPARTSTWGAVKALYR